MISMFGEEPAYCSCGPYGILIVGHQYLVWPVNKLDGHWMVKSRRTVLLCGSACVDDTVRYNLGNGQDNQMLSSLY